MLKKQTNKNSVQCSCHLKNDSLEDISACIQIYKTLWNQYTEVTKVCKTDQVSEWESSVAWHWSVKVSYPKNLDPDRQLPVFLSWVWPLNCQTPSCVMKSTLTRKFLLYISEVYILVLNALSCHQDHIWSEGKHKYLRFSFKHVGRLPVCQKSNLWLKSPAFRVIHNILNYGRINGIY